MANENDRFEMADFKFGIVFFHDKLLNKDWSCSVFLWFAINSTTMDDHRNVEVTEALFEQATHQQINDL